MIIQSITRERAACRSPEGRSNQGRAARVVVILRDRVLADVTVSMLLAHGIQAIAFARPTAALEELEHSRATDVLVTSADFQPGYPKGISLARVTRRRHPLLKVIFVDRQQVAEDVAGESNNFVPTPATGVEVARAVARLIQRRH
jgi:hypothetical protein